MVQMHSKLVRHLARHKVALERQLELLQSESEGFFAQSIGKTRRDAKIQALLDALACFKDDTFDTLAFTEQHANWQESAAYAGVFSKRTQTALEALAKTIRKATRQGLIVHNQLPHDENMCQQIRRGFIVKNNNGYYQLKDMRQKPTKKERIMALISSIFALPAWVISFFFSRFIAEIALDPRHAKPQKHVNHVYLSEPDDEISEELVVINLMPQQKYKFFNDYFLNLKHKFVKLPFVSPETKRNIFLSNQQEKQHVDEMLAEVGRLLQGDSKADKCQNKEFRPEQLHFKGIEGLDEALRAYCLKTLKTQYGITMENQDPRLQLEFFTLQTTDGAALDSVALSMGREQEKPMAERQFVIRCFPKGQNYISRIKDSYHTAQQMDATYIGFNFRGVDYSRGLVWTQKDMVKDVVSQVERLLALGARPENIGIEGMCLAGAMATLASAELHARGYPVKLYNERSFRSLPRFLAGVLLPERNNWWDPTTYFRYAVAGLVYVIFTPILWLSGWFADAAAAWNAIPYTDRDYSVVREGADVTDGVIHDSWSSIASLMDEKRAQAGYKFKRKQPLTDEDVDLLTQCLDTHHFTVKPRHQAFDCDERVAKQCFSLPHFYTRNRLFKTHDRASSMHDHVGERFQKMFENNSNNQNIKCPHPA